MLEMAFDSSSLTEILTLSTACELIKVKHVLCIDFYYGLQSPHRNWFNPCVHIFITQAVFVGLVDPLHFWIFNSTQSNNFMLKYSTDVYFIPVTSNINRIHNKYNSSHLCVKVF